MTSDWAVTVTAAPRSHPFLLWRRPVILYLLPVLPPAHRPSPQSAHLSPSPEPLTCLHSCSSVPNRPLFKYLFIRVCQHKTGQGRKSAAELLPGGVWISSHTYSIQWLPFLMCDCLHWCLYNLQLHILNIPATHQGLELIWLQHVTTVWLWMAG